MGKLERFEAGQSIFKVGQQCLCIHIIISGMVDIVIDDGEKVLILDTLGQGSYIGAYSNLLEETYNYSARGAFRAGTIIFTLKTETIK
jgi:CRP-like cAMP-binding protein